MKYFKVFIFFSFFVFGLQSNADIQDVIQIIESEQTYLNCLQKLPETSPLLKFLKSARMEKFEAANNVIDVCRKQYSDSF